MMKRSKADPKFKKFIRARQKRVNSLLNSYLHAATKGAPKELTNAIKYAVLNGGKRLRPLLIYAVGEAFGAGPRFLDAGALAIEMINSFSLVHDDLPAMDDDNLRRGKPTCHLAFDEATAILAGDTLSILAFQVLSENQALTSQKKIEMIKVLAEASGSKGIAGGQYLDLHPPKKLTSIELERISLLKTGALINAALKLGALASNVGKKDLKRLEQFALKIGLAFQIQDDILNIEGNTSRLGKNTGTDKKQNKVTYPMLVGMKRAKAKLKKLHQESNKILRELKIEKSFLSDLSSFIMERDF